MEEPAAFNDIFGAGDDAQNDAENNNEAGDGIENVFGALPSGETPHHHHDVAQKEDPDTGIQETRLSDEENDGF